ncbi:NAD-dependent epimerase/dehydratase family protein [Caballeronia glebae]|uniref:NAD-dependent epimerase/dehydratase family protein n=1 Tax=Caballeronia glebae TaxID=1777143 RepID=UPI0038BD0E72
MTVLLTGATSGLGRNAVDFLKRRGVSIRATGRNTVAGAALRAQGVEFIRADVATARTDEIDRLLAGVTTVWHCAALSSPWGRAQDFHAINVGATERLAQAAVQNGVRRFIHISTPSLYFDYRDRIAVPETFRPARYANHYARTKAQAEDVIKKIASRSPKTTFAMLRPRGIFGPHDAVLLPRIVRLLRERHGCLPLPRGGAALLDLTYAENVVHAMQLATSCEGLASGDVFNITNGEPSTLRGMLDALLPALGMAYRIVSMPYPLLDGAARFMQMASGLSGREPLFTRYSIGVLRYDMTLDISKAESILGYHPIVSLEQAIEKTRKWIRAHGDDYGP